MPVAAARMLSASTVTLCPGHVTVPASVHAATFHDRTGHIGCLTALSTSSASSAAPRESKKACEVRFHRCGSGFSHEDTKTRRHEDAAVTDNAMPRRSGPTRFSYAS